MLVNNVLEACEMVVDVALSAAGKWCGELQRR